MSSTTQPEPEMVTSIGELSWFQEVLAGSRARLDTASEGSKTEWYKENQDFEADRQQTRAS